jgi:ssDNA-binding replication factor A large subunit
MSLSFIDMVSMLLKQKPDLSAELVRNMVDEKKRKVGAGYLTDQGALFLVAADLGISFESVPKVQSGLKDLYVGAKDITVTGRIMNIYPIHKFTKKDSNEESSTRTLVVYDKDARVRVKLWDKQVVAPDGMGLQSGDLVKIVKGYVRAGLDGKPILNLGSYSALEVIKDDPGQIPGLDSIAVGIDDVKETQDSAVVSGIVNSNPRISEFVNQRGEASKSLQLQMSNEANTRTLRAVIWNVDESRVPKVFKTGSKARLVGVRVKQGNPQFGNGDFELHGDEGTILEFSGSQEDVDVMPFRIISVGEETGRGSFVALAADRAGRTLTLTIDNSLASASQLEPGAMVECVPSRIFGNSVTLSKEDSYLRVIDEDKSFIKLEKFESKIKDIAPAAEPAPVIVEAIVLQAPDTADVNTKSGETVTVTSTLLGDDTGEIRLVGWRAQSNAVNRLAVGDRVRVIGATAGAGREGKPELTMRSYSSVVHLG